MSGVPDEIHLQVVARHHSGQEGKMLIADVWHFEVNDGSPADQICLPFSDSSSDGQNAIDRQGSRSFPRYIGLD